MPLRCWFVMPRDSPPTFVLRPKMLAPPGATSETLTDGSGGRGAAGPTVGRGRPSIGAPAFWGCTPGWGCTPFWSGTPGWGLTGRCCAAAPVTTASSTATARRGPRPPRRRIMTLASANRRPFVKSPAHPHVDPVAGRGVVAAACDRQPGPDEPRQPLRHRRAASGVVVAPCARLVRRRRAGDRAGRLGSVAVVGAMARRSPPSGGARRAAPARGPRRPTAPGTTRRCARGRSSSGSSACIRDTVRRRSSRTSRPYGPMPSCGRSSRGCKRPSSPARSAGTARPSRRRCVGHGRDVATSRSRPPCPR
jgi:hypothetical protein